MSEYDLTVAGLIAKLQGLPQDMPVGNWNGDSVVDAGEGTRYTDDGDEPYVVIVCSEDR